MAMKYDEQRQNWYDDGLGGPNDEGWDKNYTSSNSSIPKAVPNYESKFWTENAPLIKTKSELGEAQRIWSEMTTAVQNGKTWDEAYNQYAAPWQEDQASKYATAEEIKTATENIPQNPWDESKFKTENADIIAAIDASVAGGMPSLQTGDVTKWQTELQKMYAPYEQQTVKDINLSSNLASPTSYGSSVQDKNIADALAQSRASQGQQALGLAQSDLATRQGQYNQALGKKFDLADYYQQMKQTAFGTQSGDYWKQLGRKWQMQDTSSAQSQADRDYYRQSDLARQLAEMSKPKQPEWYDYLAQIASPFLQGTGAGLGYSLMKGSPSALTPTGGFGAASTLLL